MRRLRTLSLSIYICLAFSLSLPLSLLLSSSYSLHCRAHGPGLVPFADLFNHLSGSEHVHFTGDVVAEAGKGEEKAAEERGAAGRDEMPQGDAHLHRVRCVERASPWSSVETTVHSCTAE